MITLHKFMFYWGSFWAAWCLGCLISNVHQGKWGWVMVLAVCVVIDSWVAYIGYKHKNGYGTPNS